MWAGLENATARTIVSIYDVHSTNRKAQTLIFALINLVENSTHEIISRVLSSRSSRVRAPGKKRKAKEESGPPKNERTAKRQKNNQPAESQPKEVALHAENILNQMQCSSDPPPQPSSQFDESSAPPVAPMAVDSDAVQETGDSDTEPIPLAAVAPEVPEAPSVRSFDIISFFDNLAMKMCHRIFMRLLTRISRKMKGQRALIAFQPKSRRRCQTLAVRSSLHAQGKSRHLSILMMRLFRESMRRLLLQYRRTRTTFFFMLR